MHSLATPFAIIERILKYIQVVSSFIFVHSKIFNYILDGKKLEHPGDICEIVGILHSEYFDLYILLCICNCRAINLWLTSISSLTEERSGKIPKQVITLWVLVYDHMSYNKKVLVAFLLVYRTYTQVLTYSNYSLLWWSAVQLAPVQTGVQTMQTPGFWSNGRGDDI